MGRNIYVYIWISKLLFCTPETNSVVNQLYFSKKKIIIIGANEMALQDYSKSW